MEYKVYIAGKIGTWALDKVPVAIEDKFEKAEKELKKIMPSCKIINPLHLANEVNREFKVKNEGYTLEDLNARAQKRILFKRDIQELMDCRAIYLLKDWKTSKGAQLEKQIAEGLGIEVLYQE